TRRESPRKVLGTALVSCRRFKQMLRNSRMMPRKPIAILWVVLCLVLPCAVYSAGVADAANAAQSRDMNTLRTLLRQRVDVNATQADGTTALHWAAHWNDI